MKDRIIELRNQLNLSQTAFGEKIGLSRNAIAAYERGIANPTGSAIVAIVNVFGVNQRWLETGEGEMFDAAGHAGEAARLVESVGESPAMRSLLATWAQLSDENKVVFERFASNYVNDYNQRMAKDKIAQAEALVDEAAAEPDAEQKQA